MNCYSLGIFDDTSVLLVILEKSLNPFHSLAGLFQLSLSVVMLCYFPLLVINYLVSELALEEQQSIFSTSK